MSSSPRIHELATYQVFAIPLSDEEILAQLLDEVLPMRKVAGQIIHSIGMGGLAQELANAPVGLQRFGLTILQVQRLKRAYELISRCMIADYLTTTQIWSADDAAVLLQARMRHLDHEELHVLVLDTMHHVISYHQLYKGTVSQSDLRIAEVLRPAVIRNGPKMLIAHNHPSGSPEPSSDDYAITLQLVAASKMLGIELLDHLILGNPDYVSLKSRLGW